MTVHRVAQFKTKTPDKLSPWTTVGKVRRTTLHPRFTMRTFAGKVR